MRTKPQHSQPNGRPVHPECALLDRGGRECTCDYNWSFWGGDEEALDRMARNTRISEARRRPAVTRDGDLDELFREGTMADLDSLSNADLSGFWSEAEALQTVLDGKAVKDSENSDLDES